MDVEWSMWHVASVVILALAIVLEAVGAYCAQKERVAKWAGRLVAPRSLEKDGQTTFFRGRRRSITPWARLWLRSVEHEEYPGVIDAVHRAKSLDPEIGPVLRGVARLSVATLFLARFASGQPPPFSGS